MEIWWYFGVGETKRFWMRWLFVLGPHNEFEHETIPQETVRPEIRRYTIVAAVFLQRVKSIAQERLQQKENAGKWDSVLSKCQAVRHSQQSEGEALEDTRHGCATTISKQGT